jgi:hypothetical protein
LLVKTAAKLSVGSSNAMTVKEIGRGERVGFSKGTKFALPVPTEKPLGNAEEEVR